MEHFSRIQEPTKKYIIILSILILILYLFSLYLLITNSPIINNVHLIISGYSEVEEVEEKETNYYSRKIKDNTTDEGNTRIVQKGVNGKERIKYKVLRNKKGIEIKRELISKQIVAVAKDEIIIIGSKKPNNSSNSTNTSKPNQTPSKEKSSNPASKNPQPQTSKAEKYYYCTTQGGAEKGNTYYFRYFVKQKGADCGVRVTNAFSYGRFDAKATEEEFYSHEVFSKSGRIGDGIVEIRIQKCGYSYYGEDLHGEACGCYNASPTAYFQQTRKCQNPKN